LQGNFAHYGVIENRHENSILDISFAPAFVSNETQKEAIEITRNILEQLNVVGVLCVEFFLTKDGKLLVNELAPRPHNSGHLTVDACVTSQFEQQLRAVCGFNLGSTEFFASCAMANLLGDLWKNGEPNWANALQIPNVKLHLYGKSEARLERKMGHLTAVAETVDKAVETIKKARAILA
jgi:5-(carboxyamino)imidazole ribonucleotide synthase